MDLINKYINNILIILGEPLAHVYLLLSIQHIIATSGKRRKLRATSTWDHFREAEGDEPPTKDGNVLHYCKRCGNPTWSTYVSGNARNHLESAHHTFVQEDSRPQKKRQQAIENAFARTTVKQMQQSKEKERNTLRNAINFDGFREAQMLPSARRLQACSTELWVVNDLIRKLCGST
jgi:hypothetical protein